jgi:uncharacterized protein with HEPN domain
MSNDEIIDNLDLVVESIHLVQERFSRIRVPDDFVLTPEGVTLLDAISMRLQVIGESVKQIQKTNPSFLQRYAEIDWDKIARFRDLVSHHYENVDHEIVYDICKTHIPHLSEVTQKMRTALSESGSL